jgi:TPR repeat protein
MRKQFPLLVLLLCVGCATQSTPDSAYNRGVRAYRRNNYGEAATQWVTAAELGDVNAKNNLAFLLFNGLGVVKQQERALALWQAAAMQGNAESQWHLGAAYEAGQFVEIDKALAYAWYRCAIASAEVHLKNGPDSTEQEIANDAKTSIIDLTDQLTQPELLRGQQLAAEFIRKYAA